MRFSWTFFFIENHYLRWFTKKFLGDVRFGMTLIDAFEKYSSQKKRWEKYILESKNSYLKISNQYLVLPPFFSIIDFKTFGSLRICVRIVSFGKFFAVLPIWLNKLFIFWRDFGRALNFFLVSSLKQSWVCSFGIVSWLLKFIIVLDFRNLWAHFELLWVEVQHAGWSFQNVTTHNLVLLRVLTILFVNFGISRKPWCRRFEWTTYKRKILKESRDTAILRRNIFLASGRKSRKNSRQIFGANWELLEWTQTPSLFKRPSWNHANLESSSSERM